MPTIKMIVTHLKPHLDEIVAIWLLRRWGREKYPGIDQAGIAYWTNGGELLGGRTAAEWESDGYLLVGVGRGRLDDHCDGQEKKESAAILVAKDLGVEEDPALFKILSFTHRIDTKGGSHPFDLFALTKVMFQYGDQDQAIAWATMVLEAKYLEQLEGQAAKADLAKAEIHDLMVGQKPCRLVVLKTDNSASASLARVAKPKGLGAAVVLTQRSSGHVQIFCDKQNWQLEDVACLLRAGERSSKGLEEPLAPELLVGEGKVEGAEEWHYQRAGQMLLNGSLSHPDVPVTQLSLPTIVSAVILGLRADYLPHSHCRETGQCLGEACQFHHFGLNRCQVLAATPKPFDWRSLPQA